MLLDQSTPGEANVFMTEVWLSVDLATLSDGVAYDIIRRHIVRLEIL